MRFPPSILDEIKTRLPVTAVVGKRVRLIKAGREWKGLSPFNAEKSPSFFVNDDKQRYFDFSSGKNGDIFNFVMETEGLSFAEAVERLAAEAGVILPAFTPESAEREERRQGLHEVVELAAAFFEAQLASPAGSRARAYLDGRDIPPAVRRHFRLGFAPGERYALRDHLAAKGVERDTMIEAGLLVSADDIAVPYDRFRDRVMFPICDSRGRPIAFGGRAMSAEVQPKYLNSPETPLFHKGAQLYNYHNARKALHEAGKNTSNDAGRPAGPAGIVVVEGYVDVIAMTMAGIAQAVAPLGTALTQEQLALLWRACDAPLLCFDGDKAGRRAAFRAIDVALPVLVPGKSVQFAMLPEGQDPDDLLRRSGPAAVREAVERAHPLVELLWTRETETHPLDTPDQRAALEHRIREVVQDIKDETLRRHYRAEMDSRVSALMPSGRQGYRENGSERGGRGNWRGEQGSGRAGNGGTGKGRQGGFGGRGGAGLQPAAPLRASAALAGSALFRASRESPREMLILLVLVAHPQLLARHCEELAAIDFTGREARALARRLIDCAAVHDEDEGERLAARIREGGLHDELLRLRPLLTPGDTWALADDADLHGVDEMLRQVMTLHRRAGALNSELRAAERAFSEDAGEASLTWLNDVKARLTSLEGTEAEMEGAPNGGNLRIS